MIFHFEVINRSSKGERSSSLFPSTRDGTSNISDVTSIGFAGGVNLGYSQELVEGLP